MYHHTDPRYRYYYQNRTHQSHSSGYTGIYTPEQYSCRCYFLHGCLNLVLWVHFLFSFGEFSRVVMGKVCLRQV
jgi:hypothetical protein